MLDATAVGQKRPPGQHPRLFALSVRLAVDAVPRSIEQSGSHISNSKYFVWATSQMTETRPDSFGAGGCRKHVAKKDRSTKRPGFAALHTFI